MLATNYMGTFLLTGLLLPKLLAQPHKSRIVFINTNLINKVLVTLFAMPMFCNFCFFSSAFDLQNLNSEDESKKFDGFATYKSTKLATALFASELAERLKSSNITVLMTDPGRTRTNLSKKQGHQQFFLSRWLVGLVGFVMGERRLEKATRPILYASADPEIEGKTKLFFE